MKQKKITFTKSYGQAGHFLFDSREWVGTPCFYFMKILNQDNSFSIDHNNLSLSQQ